MDERKFLDEQEQLQLRECVRRRVERAGFRRGPWLEWFVVEVALETGLRVFEMAGLACNDLLVGLERPGVRVRRGKGGKSRFVKVRREFCREAEDFQDSESISPPYDDSQEVA